MNDRVPRALRGEPVDRTPVWFMRQAGRYMAEYREVRSRVSFLELCGNAELACEVTCQPIDRFDVDAAIVFSDILVVLEAMGRELFDEMIVPVDDPLLQLERSPVRKPAMHRTGPQLFDQLTMPSSSTSKTRAAPPGMLGGAPRSP